MILLVPENILTHWFPELLAGNLKTSKDLGGPNN
jgi:hypothetical protein